MMASPNVFRAEERCTFALMRRLIVIWLIRASQMWRDGTLSITLTAAAVAHHWRHSVLKPWRWNHWNHSQYIKVITLEICIMKSVLLGFSFIMKYSMRETRQKERKKVYPEAYNNSTVWHSEMKYLLCDVTVRTIVRLTHDELQTQDRSAENRICIHDEDVGVWSESCVWIHDADEWS